MRPRLIGVEAGGRGPGEGNNAVRMTDVGKTGIAQGYKSRFLLDGDGQLLHTHSVSAGLDYPGIGPQLAHLGMSGRLEFRSALDDEALQALKFFARTEGIIFALESAHAGAEARSSWPGSWDRGKTLVVNMSGRGDKDIFISAPHLGRGELGELSERRGGTAGKGKIGTGFRNVWCNARIKEERMEISLASISDCPRILELQHLSYRQEAEIYGDYKIPPLTQTLGELREEFSNSTTFIIRVNQSIIGSIRAFVKDGKCHIGRLIVHPDFQNKGIGYLLMGTVETYFRIIGISNFELFTGDKSEKNLYFYRKLGYKRFKVESLNEKINLVYLRK